MLKRIKSDWYVNVFFMVITILFTMIFAKSGKIVMGDDALWHLNRLSEFINAVHNHNNIINLYSFNSFANVGSAVQNFYPNMLLFPFAVFYYFNHSLVWSFYLGVILFTYLTLVIAYYCYKNFSKRHTGALFFAVLYTFANYRLSNIFIRFAVGEWLAMTFIPLVILGLYKIFIAREKNGSYILATGIGLILYSHVLSGMIAIALVGISWLLSLIFDHTHWRQVTLAVVKGGILSLLVSLPLFIQLVRLRSYITTPVIPQLSKGAIQVTQLLNFGAHNYINLDTGLISFVIIIGFIFFIKRASKVYLGSYILMLLSIFLTTNLFPWHLLQHTPVVILQFPSRLLMYAALFIAITGAYLFDKITDKFKIYKLEAVILFLAMILGLNLYAEQRLANARFTTYQQITTIEPTNVNTIVISDKTMPTFLNYLRTVGYLEDYWPKASFKHRQSIASQTILSKNNTVKFIKMPIQRNNVVKFSVINHGSTQVADLPILNYKNQYNLVDNGKAKTYTVSQRGTIAVVLSAGKHDIQLKTKPLPLQSLIELLMMGSWLFIFYRLFKLRK
ncbi:hypothetical protein WFA24289_01896 [Periweissella fabaria]|nr:hypothetical protein WFA24289_01896 [Periweissella fabaria]